MKETGKKQNPELTGETGQRDIRNTTGKELAGEKWPEWIREIKMHLRIERYRRYRFLISEPDLDFLLFCWRRNGYQVTAIDCTEEMLADGACVMPERWQTRIRWDTDGCEQQLGFFRIKVLIW